MRLPNFLRRKPPPPTALTMPGLRSRDPLAAIPLSEYDPRRRLVRDAEFHASLGGAVQREVLAWLDENKAALRDRKITLDLGIRRHQVEFTSGFHEVTLFLFPDKAIVDVKNTGELRATYYERCDETEPVDLARLVLFDAFRSL